MRIGTSDRMLLRTVIFLSLVLMLWGGQRLLSTPGPLSTPAFSYWEVQTVEMHDSSGALRLFRNGKDWRVGGHDGPLANERRVHALIARWTRGLDTARPVKVDGGKDVLGFGATPRRLVLFGTSRRPILDLDFGRRRAGGEVYLREHDTDLVSAAVLLPGPGVSSRPEDWVDASNTPEE